MARITGSRFNAPSGSESDYASGAGEAPVVTGNGKPETGHVGVGPSSVSRFPFLVSRVS